MGNATPFRNHRPLKIVLAAVLTLGIVPGVAWSLSQEPFKRYGDVASDSMFKDDMNRLRRALSNGGSYER